MNTCEQCHEPFEPGTYGTRFCSRSCRQKWIVAKRWAGHTVPAKICEQCHQEYQPNRHYQTKQRFCSVACRNRHTGEAARTKLTVLCAHCKKPFNRSVSGVKRVRVEGQVFCSRGCTKAFYDEHGWPQRRSISRQCVYCQNPFERPTSWFKKKNFKGMYCSLQCCHAHWRETKPAFRGNGNGDGTFHDKDGYVHEYDPLRQRMVRQHRLVMERIIGRPLFKWETPHHKNGRRDDNSPDNLELWVKGQPSGVRVVDVYAKDIERLALENYYLKQRLAGLDMLQYAAV